MKKCILGMTALMIVTFGGIGCARGKNLNMRAFVWRQENGYACEESYCGRCGGVCDGTCGGGCDDTYGGAYCDRYDGVCDDGMRAPMQDCDRMRQDHSAYGCHGQETGSSHHGRHHR